MDNNLVYQYNNILNEWYKGKSYDYIYNMILDFIHKYPIVLDIDEIYEINEQIEDNDSIGDIVEKFIEIKYIFT